MMKIAARDWATCLICLIAPISALADQPLANPSEVFQQTNQTPAAPPSTVMSSDFSPGCSTNPTTAPVCGNPATSNTCCWDVNQCCNLHPFIGVEATFLNPNIRGADASATVNGNQVGSAHAEGFYGAPRIWAGTMIGDSPYFAQVQYWQLAGNNSQNFTGPTYGTSNGSLYASTFDFELGRMFCLKRINTSGAFTFGGRYVDWSESNSILINQVTSSQQLLSSSAASASKFSGTGLTFGYQLLHPVGCCGWSLFAGNRYSWIWGPQQAEANTSASASQTNAAAGSANGGVTGNNSTLFIVEAQLGTQWQRQLACMKADAFVRFAVEYQYWSTNSSGQATAASFAGVTPPPVLATANANSGPLDMQLVGLAVSTGINW
jgi:hypothetical protein